MLRTQLLPLLRRQCAQLFAASLNLLPLLLHVCPHLLTHRVTLLRRELARTRRMQTTLQLLALPREHGDTTTARTRAAELPLHPTHRNAATPETRPSKLTCARPLRTRLLQLRYQRLGALLRTHLDLLQLRDLRGRQLQHTLQRKHPRRRLAGRTARALHPTKSLRLRNGR
jgi:hypothetical protein